MSRRRIEHFAVDIDLEVDDDLYYASTDNLTIPKLEIVVDRRVKLQMKLGKFARRHLCYSCAPHRLFDHTCFIQDSMEGVHAIIDNMNKIIDRLCFMGFNPRGTIKVSHFMIDKSTSTIILDRP